MPPVVATWRIYVRATTLVGGARNVEVPVHGDAPIEVAVPVTLLPAFAIGDRVYAEELLAFGPDVPARFLTAALTAIQADLATYPGVVSVAAVHWVQRVQ